MSNTQYSEHTQSPQSGVPAPAPSKGSNGIAVAGFVLGILGFLGAFIPVVNIVAIVLAVIGAVLAAVGLARSKSVHVGKGLAIAGLVLSVLALIIAIIIDVAVGSAVNNAVKVATNTTVKTPATAGSKGTSGASKVGTSRDSKFGTTRANPAPIGTSISGGGWTVRVNSVKTASHDSMGQNPGTGKVLLVVNITARYTGHDQQGDTAFSTVNYVAPNGRSYDGTEGNTMFIPNHQFDSMKTLYHGASETGNEMFEIPASNWKQGVLAVSPGMLSDDTFVAVK